MLIDFNLKTCSKYIHAQEATVTVDNPTLDTDTLSLKGKKLLTTLLKENFYIEMPKEDLAELVTIVDDLTNTVSNPKPVVYNTKPLPAALVDNNFLARTGFGSGFATNVDDGIIQLTLAPANASVNILGPSVSGVYPKADSEISVAFAITAVGDRQVEVFKEKNYNVLYLTEYVDEFAIMALGEYEGRKFVNVSKENTDLSTEEEKEQIKKENEDNTDLLKDMKEVLNGKVEEVKFTNKLKKHPVCLTTNGEISTSMEKVINAMPTDEKITASEVLEININHNISKKLKDLYKNNKEEFNKYTKVIYYEARLIEGLPIDNPTEFSDLICDIIAEK